MGDFFYRNLRFVACPIQVPSLEEIANKAEASGTDKQEALQAKAKELLDESLAHRKPLLDVLDSLYLEPWANSWMKHSGENFELMCSKDSAESKKWDACRSAYWQEIIDHAVAIAQNIDPDSDDSVDKLKRAMPNRLAWVKAGLLFVSWPPFMQSMPMGNKYIFSQVQKLFHDESRKFSLTGIIRVVSHPLSSSRMMTLALTDLPL
jgi:hypothetical protein